MSRDPRYDILFEPVKIGPVTARNRFYQVPHCNGMGWIQPQALAELRAIKAEGGWAVVSTEEVEIHPTGDCEYFHEGRLWSDADLPALAMMAEAVHYHGALAAIEIMHHGASSANWASREVPIAPSHRPIIYYAPVQARRMDKSDIAAFRKWHRAAALRAKRAEFDVVYVYASHDLSLPLHFLQSRKNDRSDEYGGSFENRIRLLREVIEDTKDAVGDRCAVALRFGVDELMGKHGITADGEGRDVVERLAELPDLWDINLSSWTNDSATSRFKKEGFQEEFTRWVKTVTTKPVVGVGRYTSPDKMVSLVKSGILDFIGAARPSIADPFLPKKIEDGRINEIRECIGCNMCVSSDYTCTNLRCTQNPTMGEEWRRGWHPERIAAKKSDRTVLIVGAGPAGLEAALSAGRRGYEVHLAEAGFELGGRVTKEARLPGLAEWARVRDWRTGRIATMPNVHVYRDSRMTAEDVLGFGAGHVGLATGADWRRDGIGREHGTAVPGFDLPGVLTPDDMMAGAQPMGPVVVFDDDHYYMGGLMAEMGCVMGLEVTLVTPANIPSAWTVNTLEQGPIAKRLARLGITVLTCTSVTGFDGANVALSYALPGTTGTLPAATVISVTARLPREALYLDLMAAGRAVANAGITTLRQIGDCLSPSTIQAATYWGHRFARELDEEVLDPALIPRELPQAPTLRRHWGAAR